MLTGNVKLFKEPDLIGKVKLGDPLLLPTAYKDVASADSGLDEDTDELFRYTVTVICETRWLLQHCISHSTLSLFPFSG